MIRMLCSVLGSAAALSSAPLAFANEAAACGAPVGLTGELAPWTSPLPLLAAASSDHAVHAGLAVGQAATVTLLPTAQVRYPLTPKKPAGSASYGGLLNVEIAQTGTYSVALGAGAWVDLERDDKAVASVAHAHGPACTGIRKMVDFPLEPGSYTLMLAGGSVSQIAAMVVKLP